MQLANKKYIEYLFSDDPNAVEPADKDLSLWEYITTALGAIGIRKEYLIDLFDITPVTLHHWEKGDRQISQDKLVVLANLFGVTIDQLIKRDLNDDYMHEDFMGFIEMQNKKSPKELSYSNLDYLFMHLAEAEASIEYFTLGFIPSNHNDWESEPEDERYHIDSTMLEYFCKSLDLDAKYDLKSGEKITIESISFDELCSVSKQLTIDWGKEAPRHIHSHYSKKYDELLLLSENHEFLEHLINYWKLDLNYYLMLWFNLKEKDNNFDKENAMAKILLSHDAQVIFDNKPNKEITNELLIKLIKEDAKRYTDSRKEE